MKIMSDGDDGSDEKDAHQYADAISAPSRRDSSPLGHVCPCLLQLDKMASDDGC